MKIQRIQVGNNFLVVVLQHFIEAVHTWYMCARQLFLFFSFCLWVLQTNLHLTSKKSSWPTDGDALIFQEAIFYLSLLHESHSFFKPKQFTSLEASVFNEEPQLQKRGQ